MAQIPVRALGMAWYTSQDYRRILEIMEDAEKLPTTYDKWCQLAERGEREAKRAGHIVIRAIIDPQEFRVWAHARGLNIDAKARVAFANEVAHSHVKNTH